MICCMLWYVSLSCRLGMSVGFSLVVVRYMVPYQCLTILDIHFFIYFLSRFSYSLVVVTYTRKCYGIAFFSPIHWVDMLGECLGLCHYVWVTTWTKYCVLFFLDDSKTFVLLRITVPVEFSPTHCPHAVLDFSLKFVFSALFPIFFMEIF